MELTGSVSASEPWIDSKPEQQNGPATEDAATDQTHSIVPIVLSGGGGSRLWPFSTNETPKQFLSLFGCTKSLFRQALDRVRDRARFRAPIVVANLQHVEICERELAGEFDGAALILEPSGRNTAPAIVTAAIVASEIHGDDALLLVMPSDHLIERVDDFHDAVAMALPAARMGKLVTFGIRPTGPETGYGYLEMGSPIDGAPGVRTVARFVEKPRQAVAEELIAAGGHLWNAGIFLFRASTILEQARIFAPVTTTMSRAALSAGERNGLRIIPDAQIFSECPSESVDCAIMERSSSVAVVPMSPGWSDLGSWDAVAAVLGNQAPAGPITAVDCEGCYMRSDGVQVAALGVRDLIVVASAGRVLILPRGRSQEVKTLLSAMDSMAA
jgi:mannose-1-phosphate guanylyltransferase/mannose-1-phosphate guanylyltransferase/mannose-6-phosphate isomerase